ncbi:MAG: TetR/AcrR family transcriptional regulator [Planctomycetota bacterium]
MPRPSRIDQKRRELLPILVRAFAELGFRRATTAELASRCGVQENILYRLFEDKKQMFVAAIDYVYEHSLRVWREILQGDARGSSAAQRLLDTRASTMANRVCTASCSPA